jgi:hypothetical protein
MVGALGGQDLPRVRPKAGRSWLVTPSSIQPDTNAAKFWLMSRQRHLWRKTQAVEHIGSIEARLRAMTPEQRRVRLMELQAKVDAVVAWNRHHASEDQPIEDADQDGQRPQSADVELNEGEPGLSRRGSSTISRRRCYTKVRTGTGVRTPFSNRLIQWSFPDGRTASCVLAWFGRPAKHRPRHGMHLVLEECANAPMFVGGYGIRGGGTP